MLQLKSRIWIENKNGVFLGEGRIALLKAINNEGSLSKAAKKLNMSYKKAWHLIDQINAHAPEAMVVKSTGGANGGGTVITTFGLQQIELFEQTKQKCWQFMAEESKKLNKNI